MNFAVSFEEQRSARYSLGLTLYIKDVNGELYVMMKNIAGILESPHLRDTWLGNKKNKLKREDEELTY